MRIYHLSSYVPFSDTHMYIYIYIYIYIICICCNIIYTHIDPPTWLPIKLARLRNAPKSFRGLYGVFHLRVEFSRMLDVAQGLRGNGFRNHGLHGAPHAKEVGHFCMVRS